MNNKECCVILGTDLLIIRESLAIVSLTFQKSRVVFTNEASKLIRLAEFIERIKRWKNGNERLPVTLKIDKW